MLIDPTFLSLLRTPSMNDHHFDAMQLINQLDAAIRRADNEAITNTFDTLIKQTKTHYAHEEALMQEKKFPPYAAHKEDHDASLEAMQTAAADFAQTKEIDALRHYLNNDLTPFFLKHTETMDQVTSLFLENSEAHMPFWDQLVPRA